MLKILLFSLLFSIMFSLASYSYGLTEPCCGWGVYPHPDRGFPIQYATGIGSKKALCAPLTICPAGAFSRHDEFQYQFGFSPLPGIVIYPVLFIANVGLLFLVSYPLLLIFHTFLVKVQRKK